MDDDIENIKKEDLAVLEVKVVNQPKEETKKDYEEASEYYDTKISKEEIEEIEVEQ